MVSSMLFRGTDNIISYNMTPTKLPIVTVIIPTYNTASFIAETLDSVFAQTFRDFEVIVINDGSPDTDELERVIAPYRKQIVYLEQENRGPAGARNAGIRLARGKYIAFLDADDGWLPDYLAEQMKLFEEASYLDAVYCDAQHIGDPNLVGKTYMQTCPSAGRVTLDALIGKDCHVITSCTVALRQAVVDAGLFDERLDLRGCEDFDLWLRIAYRGGRIAYHRKVLGRYRCRPGSLSRDAMKMWQTVAAVYEKAEKSMDLAEETRVLLKTQIQRAQAHFDLEAGRNFLSAGDFDRAKGSLSKANNFFHRAKLNATILGLRLAPQWTRSAAFTWQKLISGRD
jgi:glycosyltransferase involved in cell wall biosynthesis